MAMEYEVEVDGQKYQVRFFERDGQLCVTHAGGTFPVELNTPLRSKVQFAKVNGDAKRFGYHRGKDTTDIVLDGVVYSAEVRELEHVRLAAVAKRKGGGGAVDVKSPMPGMVIAINVKVGDEVKKNQSLLSLHAMKLENDIRATRDGVVKEILVKPNDVLEKGALMIKLGGIPEKQDA
ncbi:MAG: biotin/lipoyl-containing protein [Planctomycetota bacterium]